MSPQDRETFNFDVEKMDWDTYLVRFVLGLKKYLLKEDLANLPVAQSRIRRLRNIRWTAYFCLFLFGSWLVIKRFPAAQTAWTQCLTGVHRLSLALEPFKLSN
ncbi:Fatty acyl-CoA reductase 2 [Desmophyllum pertusum]|nr:Fatty acyl-CoA reductase 2 [Desmophyllum pertusum]